MDAAQWPQVGFTRSMEEIITSNNQTQPPQQQHQQHELDGNGQRKVRPQKDQIVNCPRCNSTNTKFCYYNNYSLTQPRYFCKTCRRYWTQGGSLRNVPVGGGSRKNKRSNPQSSSSSSPSSSKIIPDLNPPTNFLIPPHNNNLHQQNPSYKIHNHGQDLNLAFPTSTMLQSMEFPKIESSGDLVDRSTRSPNSTTCSASTSTPISSMELLRTPGICSSGLGSGYVQVPMPAHSNMLYNSSSGFLNLHEMKPSLMGANFNIGSLQEGSNNQANDGVARLLFPFGDLNKFSSQNNGQTNTTRSDHQVDSHHQSIKGSSQDHHHQHQGESGYWNGMLGGETW
ncbi:hypothetical protein V2J09_013938 [Rumex salicifolius]